MASAGVVPYSKETLRGNAPRLAREAEHSPQTEDDASVFSWACVYMSIHRATADRAHAFELLDETQHERDVCFSCARFFGADLPPEVPEAVAKILRFAFFGFPRSTARDLQLQLNCCLWRARRRVGAGCPVRAARLMTRGSRAGCLQIRTGFRAPQPVSPTLVPEGGSASGCDALRPALGRR